MQRSSNSAQQAGVSLDELASYITVISATTRRNSESIGEALKTMFARFADIKTGALDETGMSINNVESALKRVNIELRDTPTSFKDVSEVIDELGPRWKYLNEIEQDNIAKAVAGVRQRESFITLMNNYNKVLDAQKIAQESAGLAAQRYQIYMQGLEAATNKFTTAWENMWMKALSSNAIKSFVDLGTVLVELAGNMNILYIAIIALTTFLSVKFMMTWQKVAAGVIDFSVAIVNATVTTEGFTAALLGAQAVLIGLGIGAVIVGLAIAYQALTKSMTDTYDAFMRLEGEASSNQKELKDLSAEYEQLSKKTTKTEEDLVRLLDIQTILNTKYGAAKDGIDIYTDAIDGNSKAIEKNIAWLKEKDQQTAKDFVTNNKDAYDQAKDFGKSKTLKMEWGQDALGIPGYQLQYNTVEEDIKKLNQKILKGEDVTGVLRKQRDALVEQWDAAKKLVIEYEKYTHMIKGNDPTTSSDAGAKNAAREKDNMENNQKIYKFTMDALKDLIVTTEDYRATVDELEKSIISIQSAMQPLINSQLEFGKITLDQVETLKNLFPENYLDMITVEGDTIKLNTAAYKDYMVTQIQTAIDKLYLLQAQDKSNVALQKEIDLLEIRKKHVLDNTTETKKSADEQKKAYDDLLKMAIDMIKERVNREKDALQEELKAFKDAIDAKKKAIQDLADSQKQALQNQLEGYKEIIDAEKALIDMKKKEADQADAVAAKNKEISDIDAQLLAIQFDNSESARAKRLQLESDKVTKTKELNKMQNDYSVDNQKSALDQEYAQFEKTNKAKQDAIEKSSKQQIEALDLEYKAFETTINAKIKDLEEYLKNTGQITADAILLLRDHTSEFYNQLLEWNRMFGTSVDEDVIGKWQQAMMYLDAYIAKAIFAKGMGSFYSDPSQIHNPGTPVGYTDVTGSTYGGTPTTHHDGGFVGGKPSLKSNEEFSKLVKGELVVTSNDMSKFMSNILPKIALGGGNTSIGDINLEINVAGNMDKSVLPNLKEMVMSTVVEAMKSRGFKRDSFAYSL